MSTKRAKPNVVFFMVDQLAAKWFEMAVNGVCDVPNFRSLMDRGTYFDNTITSNPVCMASRASLATGLTTRGHGLLENGYFLDPGLPTFMQALQRDGYVTGALGKVHFRPHFESQFPDYKAYGFDVTHVTEDGRGGEWNDWVRDNHPTHYDDVLATIWPWHIPDYSDYGEYHVDLKERIRRVREKYTWSSEKYPESTDWVYTLPFPEEVSQTNWITGHALDFISKSVASKHPFFAHVSYVQPHYPFCSPEEYIQYVDVDRIPEPVGAEWQEESSSQPAYYKRQKPVDMSNWKWGRTLYFADLVHLDRQLGRVIDRLKETGEYDNTYIVFLSDHGDLLYDHHFWGKEERHYDGCIRVPLLIAGPGLKQGQRVHDLVQLEDVCPTVLEMASTRLPHLPKLGEYLDMTAEELPVLPGRSLLPLCRGESVPDWRKSAYSESYNAIWSSNPGDWARTVRTDRYRYTYYPKGDGEQLFDLLNDPDEQKNLCQDSEYVSVKQTMKDLLLEHVILQDYPKTRRNLFAIGVH
jgi:arylsulfatase